MQEESQLIERHLIEMLTLAGEFCIAIENAENIEKSELLHILSRISPMLYLQGTLFPDTEEPEENGSERVVTQEQWENVFNALRNKIGMEDVFNYLEYNSLEQDEISRGSLSELFADIYQDMKDFVWLMTKNSLVSRKYAAYDIKQLYISNWGPKILLAQMIFHSRLLLSLQADDYSDLD
jgi:hypothetical protein